MRTRIILGSIGCAALLTACRSELSFGSNGGVVSEEGGKTQPEGMGAVGTGGPLVGAPEAGMTNVPTSGDGVLADGAATVDGSASVPAALLRASVPWDGDLHFGNVGGAGALRGRVIFFYTPHGTVLDAWRPTGEGETFQLGTILKPLTPFQSKIVVVDGISNCAVAGAPASTHESAPSVLFTAYVGQPRTAAGSPFYYAGAPSLGLLVGKRWNDEQFQSLQLGVQTEANLQPGGPVLIDYTDAELYVAPENNPRTVMARAFGGLDPSLGGLPQLTNIDLEANDSFPAIGKSEMDILVSAAAFKLAPSLSLTWGDTLSATKFTWLGADVTSTYAALADASGAGPARDQYIRAQTWFAEQFAYLLGKLAAVPEGNETLLDHSVVVWLSDTGEASSHSGASIPVVIAGGLSGYFRTGLYLKYQNRSQADLLVTLARAVGIDTMGDPAFEPKPLTELIR